MSETPYAIPLPQPSDPPADVTLEAVDGGTLRVDFSPPASTGGEEIDRYTYSQTLMGVFHNGIEEKNNLATSKIQ